MALPSSGSISFAQIAAELYNDSNRTISLSENLVRILAGVPSGPVSLSNFYGKKGNYVASKQHSGNYGWSPPASIYFNETGHSGTTSGNYQGTLNKSGGISYGQGGWANVDGTDAVYTNDTTSGYYVGEQLGGTSGPTAGDPFEYRSIVYYVENLGNYNYATHYKVYYRRQRRLWTTYQSYTGTVWLRG